MGGYPEPAIDNVIFGGFFRSVKKNPSKITVPQGIELSDDMNGSRITKCSE
jgi:hypothetical protein